MWNTRKRIDELEKRIEVQSEEIRKLQCALEISKNVSPYIRSTKHSLKDVVQLLLERFNLELEKTPSIPSKTKLVKKDEYLSPL